MHPALPPPNWLDATLKALGFAALLVLILAAVGLLGAPLLALLWRSIEHGAWRMPLDPVVWQAVRLSAQTTAFSLFFIVLLGTPLAYALARWRFFGRRWLNTLVELPIVLPPAVAGLGLLVAFGRRGIFGAELAELGIRLPFTTAAVVMAQVFVALPFYVRAAILGFRVVDVEVEQAALVDGASRLLRFVYVTLPLSRRALLSGLLMSAARALGEFGATIFFGGSLPGRTQTMTLLIYNTFERDINAAVWTAVLLLGVAAAVVFLTRLLLREDAPAEPR
ncbi:molybdate ABC transporter permease subunit [bacterium]|nr:molybdate ABC transporter permease subunit [bacterium]